MTPLPHAAVGMAAWKCVSKDDDLRALFIFMFVSCLPDIDFLLYHLLGRPSVFTHQLYSHNILFSLISALVFFPLLKNRRERTALALVALSHLVMDVIVIDDVAPVGFRAFWPFSDVFINFGFFPYVRRGSLAQVLTLKNLFAFGLELLIFVIPALIFCRREIVHLWNTRVLKKNVA
jgi:membrane-bound metal-dependent hydrolase YbcI (DUF457 family)